jgi:hypothetical protein
MSILFRIKGITAELIASTAAYTRTLVNPNPYSTSFGDMFGSAVALSGNYAVVGAQGEDNANGTNSGKAYLFNVATGALLRTLVNPSTTGGANFGQVVAISGNYAAVTAPGAGGYGIGYVYNILTGALQATLVNPNANNGTPANFGYAMAISGTAVLICDYGDTINSGVVHVYDVTTGTRMRTLTNPNINGSTVNDQFGSAVSIRGNIAAIGAQGERANSGVVYLIDVTTGTLLRTLSNPNAYGTATSDLFGNAVSSSGNYVIVGARLEGDSYGLYNGKAYIFDSTTGTLLFTLNNPSTVGPRGSDQFGWAVSCDGNYAVVSTSDSTTSGIVYVYNMTTGALLATLINPNAFGAASGDQFGSAVAISGSNILVGAFGEGDANGASSSGKAYLFNLA